MPPMNPEQDNLEILIQDISQRIESLKVEFNLYFQGEMRVPPEKERQFLEKKIRNLMYSGQKSARLTFLIQNVSSKFSLYNNMWMKRLNEIESGVSVIQRKKVAAIEAEKVKPPKPKSTTVDVSLNNEDSFEKLADKYTRLTAKKSDAAKEREKMINSIKSKMISANVIDAKISLSVVKGKLKIKIKSSH